MQEDQSTQEHINKLNAFRQAIYEQGLTRVRDAQFELIDALLQQPRISSFPELTLSPVFRRRWSSAYKAIETGAQDRRWLTEYLSQQVPEATEQVYALDETVWPRPRAKTLKGMLYDRSPTASIKGYSIVRGHVYSILAWVPEAGSSWAPPVDTRLVTVQTDTVATGIAQIDALRGARQAAGQAGLIVVVTDGRYSTWRFNRAIHCRTDVAKVGRMRSDRTLYRAPGPYRGRGRPRKHGPAFRFKDPTTWGPPREDLTFDHVKFGRVRLRRWDALHSQQDADIPLTAIRCETHLERDHPPDPLWLEYLGPDTYGAQVIWGWFQQRWSIEPANRFRKQSLHWTLPRFQHPDRCDRWTTLVDLAYWQLFLARDWVQDRPLPWQPPQVNPTPERVLQGLPAHFQHLTSPTRVPRTRGKSPGWPKARPRARPMRHKAAKRAPKRKRKRTKAT
jgi:hypothetical protein